MEELRHLQSRCMSIITSAVVSLEKVESCGHVYGVEVLN
jgi:hypothetical protein